MISFFDHFTCRAFVFFDFIMSFIWFVPCFSFFVKCMFCSRFFSGIAAATVFKMLMDASRGRTRIRLASQLILPASYCEGTVCIFWCPLCLLSHVSLSADESLTPTCVLHQRSPTMSLNCDNIVEQSRGANILMREEQHLMIMHKCTASKACCTWVDDIHIIFYHWRRMGHLRARYLFWNIYGC